MILGIGTDLVQIPRIEKLLARFGVRFENRVFTRAEQQMAAKRGGGKPAFYAKRFAAKEACIKALGGVAGASWKEMEITGKPNGQPELKVTGRVEKHLHSLLPAQATAHAHVSLSDDFPLATATVIWEARQ